MALNYDYNFLNRKSLIASKNFHLLPQWTIKKRLTEDDLQQQQLELTNEQVMALFHVNTVNLALNQQVALVVLDFDNGVLTEIVIRRVEEHCHALCEGWVDNFVNRRGLIPGQLVGFYSTGLSRRMVFSVLNNPPQAPQWTFTKRLTHEDRQQLVLVNVEVQKLFGYQSCTPDKSLQVSQSGSLAVLDFDSGTEHNITLRRVSALQQVFCDDWVRNFVTRRGLVEGHLVAFYWDYESNRLVFSLLGKFVAADNSEQDE